GARFHDRNSSQTRCGLRYHARVTIPGAQTERRGGAGPVGGLLGGKDPAGRFFRVPKTTGSPNYFFALISSSSSASTRKRRSSSLFGWCLSIHWTARSCHLRASSLSPNFQWAMARKKVLNASLCPLTTSMDISKIATDLFQLPARYSATPRVFR